jgi:hypothetical protein
LNIAAPFNGDNYWATVNVSGPCVRPANLIKSDTIVLVVKNTPTKPVVSRNFDTMKASNQGTGVYRWFNGNNLAGTGMRYKATANGNYRCVYEENGCASDTSDAISFNSLRMNDFANAPMLFPNPVIDEVQIPTGCMGVATIYTALGSLVADSKIALGNSGKPTLKVSALKSGSYFIVVTSDTGNNCIYRFIKQ